MDGLPMPQEHDNWTANDANVGTANDYATADATQELLQQALQNLADIAQFNRTITQFFCVEGSIAGASHGSPAAEPAAVP
jgi:hypothetical protein